MKPTSRRHVAVLGGGWAGCAAAVELTANGQTVSLFEAARIPGGRARRVDLDGNALDNGQHILLGAYDASLRLMRQVGIDLDQALLRLPLQMRYPPADGIGMTLVAPRLPAPWHLAVGVWRAAGLRRADKLALARFSTTARWMDWRLNVDCSVSELLNRYDQTATLIRLLWRPLCLAALNTSPEQASAQVFLQVLRDSLGGRRAASDMLLPRVDLSALFPEQAMRWIAAQGGEVEYGAAAVNLRAEGKQWRIGFRNDARPAVVVDAVVIATPPEPAALLLETAAEGIADPNVQTALNAMRGFDYRAITTCYLQYDADLRLPHPFYALTDNVGQQAPGQFVFDRGQLHAAQAGLLAVVISDADTSALADHALLAAHLGQQLAQAFGQPCLAQPRWSRVITEKRATFACTPGLQRPGLATGLSSVVLAGDYVASTYPATIETAVRSGVAAAQALLDKAQ
ncbi:hydroxysqualene dehydroxylase HpnE [Herbaspirillum sp. RTI4]|uniref:hydroxysqualene dehydroxylase HpnE n=1 Tax=Herbaspirillum sp. RTI4 TaxID=3048640 RepID=UPI002AB596F8|nr:hydroxysqualene dehydroxylase HpnE [Herbaspirillum sp. RTI4]MDY7579079.1 hydroxysqualene dehydroxylase HpnE [Herbaspirillum sp. RTI4]MEA9982337.1 hydroxysqualene dehydroxylase HpnE [Herbaspirillum sp. RTI4]